MAEKYSGKRGQSSSVARPQDAAGDRAPSAVEPGPPAAAQATPAVIGTDLGRARARVAWRWVAQVLGRDEKVRKRYGTLSRKLPSLIQVSGLGQTLAFLFAKGGRKLDNPEGLLFSQLSDHLRSRWMGAGAGDFMEAVLSLSPAAYRNATREALAVAEWLKRFAEGQLGSEEDG